MNTVTELTLADKLQRIDQAIEALKFAHDNIHQCVPGADEERYQRDLMAMVEELSLDRMAVAAAKGEIAHG